MIGIDKSMYRGYSRAPRKAYPHSKSCRVYVKISQKWRNRKMEANYPPHINIFPPKALLKMISFVGYVSFLKSNHWSRRIPCHFLGANSIYWTRLRICFLFSAAQFWHQNNPVKTAENSCHVVVGVPLVSGSWWWVGLWKCEKCLWYSGTPPGRA